MSVRRTLTSASDTGVIIPCTVSTVCAQGELLLHRLREHLRYHQQSDNNRSWIFLPRIDIFFCFEHHGNSEVRLTPTGSITRSTFFLYLFYDNWSSFSGHFGWFLMPQRVFFVLLFLLVLVLLQHNRILRLYYFMRNDASIVDLSQYDIKNLLKNVSHGYEVMFMPVSLSFIVKNWLPSRQAPLYRNSS